jgi:hypothetical protein
MTKLNFTNNGANRRSLLVIFFGIFLNPINEGISLAQAPLSIDLKTIQDYGKQTQDRNLTSLIDEYRSKTAERTWRADGGKYTFKGRYSNFNLLKNQVTLIGADGRPKDVAISKLTEEDAALVQRLAEIEAILPLSAFKDASARLDTVNRQVQSLEKALRASSQQIEVLNGQLRETIKYAPSNRIESANGIAEVDSKRLETFGSEFVGRQVRFTNAKWWKTSTTWITNLPNVQVSSNGLLTRYDAKAADRWVGFNFTDSKGELFNYAFASKAEWGEFLLALEKDQPINLVGTVIKLENSQYFGVIVFAIEKVPVSNSSWKLEVKTNPIDDSKNYILRGDPLPSDGSANVSLIVRYQNNELEIYFSTRDKLLKTSEGNIRCLVRFGEEPAKEIMGSPSTDETAAFFVPESLLTGMLRSSRITVQLPKASGGNAIAVYDLTEFKEHFLPIQNALSNGTSSPK